MKNYKKLLSAALALTLAVPGITVPTEVQAAEVQAAEQSEDGKTALVNLALGKTATANGSEASTLGPDKAVDGDTKSKSSRWASQAVDGPHWVAVDLGEKQTIQSVRLVWEMRKASSYRIQVSDDGETYTDVKVVDGRPASLDDVLVFDAVEARYVRLYIDSFTAEDPDGGTTWNTVSIYEMEVYNGVYTNPSDGIDGITVETPKKGDTKLKVNIPESSDYTITYNGTDYEQVVGEDLTIYEPLVDTKVKVSFKAVNKNDASDYEFKEIEVTIPGTYTQEAGDNEAPAIIPELREWKGTTGNFTVAEQAKVIYHDESLQKTAEAFASDYKELTGKTMEVVQGSKEQVKAGEFYFALTTDTSLGLMEEGYLMEIDDMVDVVSETSTGAMWATRTILQALKSTGNTTIPKGMTRDYPLYEVRGLILDVGRKTFSLEWLEQMTKQLSWYKMNDFQIHLNDNYIALGNYTKAGEDPLTAYSGFRMESEIKKGDTITLGKEEKTFTYSADLTSTDVYYKKDDFRSFIQEADVYGVTIVPEFDTPAHSLALTKVLPELRTGTSGTENDHLDLTNQYDECLDFVQHIFDEYLEDTDPVFDTEVIHIGCDEYTANENAFRRYCNDMADYVESKGRTARIWGSLTRLKGDGTVAVDGTGIQMNLWNFGWANMDEMYELGFDLIDCNDGHYYIVPNAGYYYDYLYANTMFNDPVNSISDVTIPAGDKQVLGGAYAVWNDMTDIEDNGMSEYDIYVRTVQHMGLFASKVWGKSEDFTLTEAQEISAVMGDAPGTDFAYTTEADEDGKIAQYTADDLKKLTGKNAAVEEVDYKEALKLNGGESYVTTGLDTVGLEKDLRVKVKRTSDSTEDQILFESSYGSIKAVQGTTGKVGITRENYDYSFDYELPVNQWVELEFKNEFEVVSLYVNGDLVDTIGDGETVMGRPLKATCMLPVEKIGSETNAFNGYVTDVRIGKEADYVSTTNLELLMQIAHSYLAEGNTNETLSAVLEEAKAVTAQFSVSAEKAAQLKAAIEEQMKDAKYEKADYTKVNAYLALVPEDLSVFTSRSQASLSNVADSIIKSLPAAMQDTVDAYEAALKKALGGLEILENLGSSYYDNSKDGTKVTASNYQSGEEPAKAIDGDESTIWHCDWSDSTSAHWFQIEFAEEQKVNSFYYLPRQSGNGNGIATSYKISVSTDGTKFEQVASGTWANDTQAKTVSFDAANAKYVRLNFVESVGGFACAAEIKVGVVPAEKDTTALAALISKVETLDQSAYSSKTWTILADSLKSAKEVLNNADSNANDIVKAQAALAKAQASLVLAETIVEQDEMVRVWGDDRNATSLAVADKLKEKLGVEKFETIIIATGKSPYDALAGSYLADKKQAPILLTGGKTETNEAMLAYIQANAVENVKIYILGGTSAVSEETETLLKGSFSNITRFDGATRVDTNLMILKEAGLTGETELLVATSLGFADSLSASATGRPILLVNSAKELNADQKAVLEQFKDAEDQVYILGGTNAVSAEKAAEIKVLTGKDAVRIEGKDRYETSVKVAGKFFEGAKKAVVACGKDKNAADGLCGGVLASAMNAPLLLTKDGEGQAAAYTSANGITSGYVLGGATVISDETAKTIFAKNVSENGKWDLPFVPFN